MPNQSLGLGTSIGGGLTSSYVKDGLKLYMPYNSPKEVKFVGQGSASFTGSSSQSLTVPDALTSGLSAFTFMCWVKRGTDGAQDSVILGNNTTGSYFRGTSNDDYYLNIVTTGTDISIYYTGSGHSYDWEHICATYDGVNTIIYADGVNKASNTTGDGTISTVLDRIGEYAAFFHTGKLKNLGVWSRALSPTEIQNAMHKTYNDLSGTLTQGIRAWYPLESSTLSGSDSVGSYDITANNNTATFSSSLYGGETPLIPRGVDNAPTVQADAIGTGFALFDGTDDYINTGATFQTTFDGSFTIAAWVKPDDGIPGGSTYRAILGSEEGGEDSVNFYIDPLGKLNFYYETNNQAKNTLSNSVVFTNGENPWHHCVAVINDTTNQVDLYFNGIKQVLDGTDDGDISGVTNANFETAVNLWIGARNDDGSVEKPFDGKIKNVGIWSSALTQPQIHSIMEKTYSELTSSEKTNLVSWWGLDSAVGDHLKHVADEHGGVLGSEILKDPEFNVDVAEGGNEPNGWQLQSSTGTWNISNGFLNCEGIAGGENCIANDNTAIVAGKTYKIVIVVSDWVQGQVLPYVGDAVGTNTSNANGTYVQYITATNTTQPILKAQSTPILKVNSFSVKEVSGNYGELK